MNSSGVFLHLKATSRQENISSGTLFTYKFVVWSHEGVITTPSQITPLHYAPKVLFEEYWVNTSEIAIPPYTSTTQPFLWFMGPNRFIVFSEGKTEVELLVEDEPHEIIINGSSTSFIYANGTCKFEIQKGVSKIEARFIRAYIYIRTDGSVDPPTAPITSSDNVTYILTGNIEKPIVVERDNIVVDGAGYTLQGTGGGKGISVLGRSDVTIKNMRIESFGYGIWLNHSSNNTMSGNNITDCGYGIWLENSSSNSISENKITGCGLIGMGLYSSSSNNRLYGNNMTNNSVGIWLQESSNNTFSGNVINDSPLANFGGVWGYELGHFMHSIDVSNLADGKPIYYLVNQTDLMISSATHPQVGYLAMINCVNVTAEDLTLTDNGEGLLLAYTNASRITDNNIIDNQYGVLLFMSFNNTFSQNTITDNYAEGFHLELSSNNTVSGNTVTNSLWGIRLYGSSNNSIYHNNFVDNINQVYIEDSVNVWNDKCPSGGNYWSDHNPPDIYNGPYQNETGRDRIGDIPYIIGGNNIDRYPLIYPYGHVPSPDANQDVIVDIVDLVICALAFGSEPGVPNWNPYADLNQDGLVDIVDLVMIALHLGETL